MRPCWGRAALFDSTDPGDHAEAKAICATCTFTDWCAGELAATQRAARFGYGPEGTWAGQLIGAEPSSRAEYRRRHRAKKAAEKQAAYAANPDRCQDCATPLPYNSTGGPRKRCEPCARTAKLAGARERNQRRKERLNTAVEAARADWDQRKKTA